MTEQLLHDPDVGAVVQEMSSAAVPEHMWGEAPFQCHPLAVVANDPPRSLACQTPTAVVQENGVRVGAPGPSRGGP